MSKTSKELTKMLFNIDTVADHTAFVKELDIAEVKSALDRQERMNLQYLETYALELVGNRIIDPSFENTFSQLQKRYREIN